MRSPELSLGGDEARKMVLSTVREWYDEKHRHASAEEVAMVNAARVDSCPFCGSGSFVGDGLGQSGVRRYRCKSCGRRFNPLTGTVFDSRRIPISERIEFLLHLFEFHSVKTSARDNKNDGKTGIFWVNQAFLVLRGSQDGIVLSGRVWVDETFVRVDPEDRRRLASGRLPRGTSRNQVCIATATDGKRAVFAVAGNGKPTKKGIASALIGHIEPGSTIVHDGERAHGLLIDSLGLASVVHATAETRGLCDRDNPMDPINDVHDKLKRFLRAHGSFKRSSLQGWLDLFAFIWNPPASRYDKVLAFIEKAISKRERVKYRDVFKKRTDKS